MIGIAVFTALFLVAACSAQPAASLGDSPLRDVRCPSFIDDKGCLARAKRECGTEHVTVLSAPADGEVMGEGNTVPIEGTIRHRTITVRCEE